MAILPMTAMRAVRAGNGAQVAVLAKSTNHLQPGSRCSSFVFGFGVMGMATREYELSFTTPWILWSIILYVIAFALCAVRRRADDAQGRRGAEGERRLGATGCRARAELPGHRGRQRHRVAAARRRRRAHGLEAVALPRRSSTRTQQRAFRDARVVSIRCRRRYSTDEAPRRARAVAIAASAASRALVLLRAGQAGAVEALLLVVEGEHAEADGLAGVERDPGEAVGRRRRDVLEVRCAAADDHAERDDRVGAGLEGGLRTRRAARSCRARARARTSAPDASSVRVGARRSGRR